MTKKDTMIAETISWHYLPANDKLSLAHAFADMLAANATNFKRGKFLKLCGVKP